MCDTICKLQPYRRKKRKGKSKKRKALILTAVLIFVICVSFAHLKINVDPIVRRISEYRVKASLSEIINRSADEVFNELYGYTDFVTVERDVNNDIILIQSDIIKINLIARSIVLNTQEEMNATIEKGIEVPLGAFSGVSILSGFGKNVTVKTVAMGAAVYDYTSAFETAGINQTLHRVYINIYADVEIILPGSNCTVTTVTPVLASESIIVGKIPQIYLNNS